MTIHPTSSIDSAGSFDTSFDTDGKANYNTAGVSEVGEYVLIDMVGNIVITGTQGNDIIVARFTKNGALDTTWFDGDGIVTTNFGGTETSFGLAIQPDGKIIAAGGSSGDFALARYLSGTNEHTFHTYDANYNVTASIDRYGVILERYTYTPYGKRTVIDEDWSSDTDGLSDVKNNFGHQGGLIDGESFLMKFRNRDLHVSLGNWVERDPAGYADGSNLFLYVDGNPLIGTDASGLIKIIPVLREKYECSNWKVKFKLEREQGDGETVIVRKFVDYHYYDCDTSGETNFPPVEKWFEPDWQLLGGEISAEVPNFPNTRGDAEIYFEVRTFRAEDTPGFLPHQSAPWDEAPTWWDTATVQSSVFSGTPSTCGTYFLWCCCTTPTTRPN